MIPKQNGKLRKLGIPTLADRVVQASLKLVLEPIFEAGFQPCSYGFRPCRRAQDAIAEIHYLHGTQVTVGAGGRHPGVFGCIVTLLPLFIVIVRTARPGAWGVRYAGLSCVRCGRGRRAACRP